MYTCVTQLGGLPARVNKNDDGDDLSDDGGDENDVFFFLIYFEVSYPHDFRCLLLLLLLLRWRQRRAAFRGADT